MIANSQLAQLNHPGTQPCSATTVEHACARCQDQTGALRMFFDTNESESCLVKAPAKHASESVLVVGELLCTGVQANTERHTRKETRAMCSCWGYKQHPTLKLVRPGLHRQMLYFFECHCHCHCHCRSVLVVCADSFSVGHFAHDDLAHDVRSHLFSVSSNESLHHFDDPKFSLVHWSSTRKLSYLDVIPAFTMSLTTASWAPSGSRRQSFTIHFARGSRNPRERWPCALISFTHRLH